MNKRRSHTTRLIAMMQAILLITGLVSPGWIWCYEGDGRTAFEFGGDCSGISILGPAADHESLSDLTGQCCVSCIDSPVFVAEERGNVFNSALALILDSVSVESDLGSHHEIPALHLGTYLTPGIFQTYLSLSKSNSVILLI